MLYQWQELYNNWHFIPMQFELTLYCCVCELCLFYFSGLWTERRSLIRDLGKMSAVLRRIRCILSHILSHDRSTEVLKSFWTRWPNSRIWKSVHPKNKKIQWYIIFYGQKKKLAMHTFLSQYILCNSFSCKGWFHSSTDCGDRKLRPYLMQHWNIKLYNVIV